MARAQRTPAMRQTCPRPRLGVLFWLRRFERDPELVDHREDCRRTRAAGREPRLYAPPGHTGQASVRHAAISTVRPSSRLCSLNC
eukprot:scaffold84336_cov51-Phaeocystis_antarctica.AAC.1